MFFKKVFETIIFQQYFSSYTFNTSFQSNGASLFALYVTVILLQTSLGVNIDLKVKILACYTI